MTLKPLPAIDAYKFASHKYFLFGSIKFEWNIHKWTDNKYRGFTVVEIVMIHVTVSLLNNVKTEIVILKVRAAFCLCTLCFFLKMNIMYTLCITNFLDKVNWPCYTTSASVTLELNILKTFLTVNLKLKQ